MYDIPFYLDSRNTRRACNLKIDSVVGNKPLLDMYRKYAEDRLCGTVKMCADLSLSIEIFGARMLYLHIYKVLGKEVIGLKF